MTSTPFGSSGSDDYFDRHKFNELQKRFDSTANDPRARAAFKKEITSPYKKGPKSAERLDARIAAARKPTAKPTPRAAKKPAARPAPKAPVARKARTPKKK
jgi:hypothetical protein